MPKSFSPVFDVMASLLGRIQGFLSPNDKTPAPLTQEEPAKGKKGKKRGESPRGSAALV